MDNIVKLLEEAIKDAEKQKKGLNIHSNEYMYWNGVWCQATYTLKELKEAMND